MGWSPYQYYTSSPCEFYYACKGYFDKEESLSRLVRIQTLCIVQASGAKLKGGGEITEQDLWKLTSDETNEKQLPSWAETAIEFRNEVLKRYRNEHTTGDNN